MNLENLQMMADMLGEVIDGTWKGVPVNHKLKIGSVKLFPERVNSFDIEQWADVTDCGFSACAVGHACFDEDFRKLGWSWLSCQPRFGGQGGLDAAQLFFGITRRQSERLFLPEEYSKVVRAKYRDMPKNVREAKMVADRVQKLMDGERI